MEGRLASCSSDWAAPVVIAMLATVLALFTLCHHFFMLVMVCRGVIVLAADGALARDIAAGIPTTG